MGTSFQRSTMPAIDSDNVTKEEITYLEKTSSHGNTQDPNLQTSAWARNLAPDERRQLERKLVRKIDIRLLPCIILMYILNYLDRNAIATARLAGNPGLQVDLRMSDQQYQTAVSILFVGYILMQVPSNLFLNKIGKPALYLPTAMVIWGIISTCTAAVHNYGGLLVVRFALGFIEASYFPGCLYYLSCWYTRKELAFRSAVLYSGSLISGAFAGLLAAAITSGLDGRNGIAAWRWLFIVEGVITIGVAIISYFILPNFPRTTAWLSDEERQLAVWRLQEDVGVDDWVSSESQSLWSGFGQCVKDVKVWLLVVILLGMVSSASVTNFFPSVVQTLGFSSTKTLLLTAPPYVLAVITSFANALHADYTGERLLHIILPLIVGMVAFILAAATTSLAPRYVAIMLMLPGIYSGYVICLAWISNTIPRPPAKRAASLALINAISNASSIYASYLYFGSPRYIVAFSVNCCTLFMALVITVVLDLHLRRLNKKLDRGEHVEGAVISIPSEEGKAFEKGFRYLV